VRAVPPAKRPFRHREAPGTASRKRRASALLDDVHVVMDVVAMMHDVMAVMPDVVTMKHNVMMMTHDVVMLDHHRRRVGDADHRGGERKRYGKAKCCKQGLLHDISLLAAGKTRPTC
jgi:hypothetical protein